MHAFPLHWAVVQLMQAELLVEMLQLLQYAPLSSTTAVDSRQNLERKGLPQALACLESALMVFDSEKHRCEYALVLFHMVSAPFARERTERGCASRFSCACGGQAKAESVGVRARNDHEQIIASMETALPLLQHICTQPELQKQVLVERELCGWCWEELLGLTHVHIALWFLLHSRDRFADLHHAAGTVLHRCRLLGACGRRPRGKLGTNCKAF
jgi:hypothetical protein